MAGCSTLLAKQVFFYKISQVFLQKKHYSCFIKIPNWDFWKIWQHKYMFILAKMNNKRKKSRAEKFIKLKPGRFISNTKKIYYISITIWSRLKDSRSQCTISIPRKKGRLLKEPVEDTLKIFLLTTTSPPPSIHMQRKRIYYQWWITEIGEILPFGIPFLIESHQHSKHCF